MHCYDGVLQKGLRLALNLALRATVLNSSTDKGVSE